MTPTLEHVDAGGGAFKFVDTRKVCDLRLRTTQRADARVQRASFSRGTPTSRLGTREMLAACAMSTRAVWQWASSTRRVSTGSIANVSEFEGDTEPFFSKTSPRDAWTRGRLATVRDHAANCQIVCLVGDEYGKPPFRESWRSGAAQFVRSGSDSCSEWHGSAACLNSVGDEVERQDTVRADDGLDALRGNANHRRRWLCLRIGELIRVPHLGDLAN